MEDAPAPHVVILPLPGQGHVKPMLGLGKLISGAGIHVTFVNTDHIHDRLRHVTDLAAFSRSFPNLVFKSVPDGFPADLPRDVKYLPELFASIGSVMKPRFRELVVSMRDRKEGPTCIVSDGTMMTVAAEVAAELEIPVVAFRTYSACATLTTLHYSQLLEKGEIPISVEDMDKLVPTFMSGLEGLLRRRDLPSICRVKDPGQDQILQFYIRETTAMARASALILNTFEELESTFVTKLASIFPKIYTIGPLQGLLKSRIDPSMSLPSNGSLSEEDRSCMMWLDSQPFRSIVYVSFGSVIAMQDDQVMEMWRGVVNSGKPFLWVTRNGVINNEKLLKEIEGKGFVASWVPQEDVLAHPSIGAFLTHCGWNSTLESIYAGVPMICWPSKYDQHVNSRCVSELWKVGLDMKDTCDSSTIEKMIRDVMEYKREEIMRSTKDIAKTAKDCVKEGGSSFDNINRLIEDIKFMRLTPNVQS